MIHIFPYPTKVKHCLDHSGFCGCQPKVMNVCPCCGGVGLVEVEEVILDPVLVHRLPNGVLCYGHPDQGPVSD